MRKGSALLIVLGMISFMLFSGIAFSVYMRQTRLPSTFLRRTTVTRQLAKAALAEAIDEIDFAIGSDPHPGVRASGNANGQQGGSQGGRGSNSEGNYWNHRVFVRNENYASNQNGYSGNDTISTLTLEGLAYLPPSLINEVRYFSRHTPTAKWQRFRFDAGRYAYCAVDVSDYFDVNRMLADRPRSSASSRRITFAHAFEGSGAGGLHGTQGGGEAEAWDEWLEGQAGVRTVDPDNDRITFNGKMPLVSLADFNLLMSTESFGLLKSPFVEYLESGGNAFYPDASSDADDAQAEAYRSMAFVTDSLFRQPTADEKDLESSDNQPFEPSDMRKSSRLALTTLQQNINGRRETPSYLQLLSRIGMATLYDYLDENSRPISLTIPSAERNPMICGIGPELDTVNFNIKVDTGDLLGERGGALTHPATRERTVSQTVSYMIDGGTLGVSLSGGAIGGLAVYPFLHGENNGSFALDGKMALYLTTGNDRLRMAQADGNYSFCFGRNGGSEPEQDVTLDENAGIVSLPMQGTMSVPSSVKRQEEALFQFNVKAGAQARNLRSLFDDSGAQGRKWISITYRWRQTVPAELEDPDLNDESIWTPQPGPAVYRWDNVVGGGAPASGDTRAMTCRWYPLDSDGNAVKNMQKIYEFVSGGTKFHLNMALWLRIRRDGDTVDMVPACLYDDKEQGLTSINPNAINADENLRRYFRNIEGRGRHIMSFRLDDATGGGFALSDVTDAKNLVLSASPKRIMVADPRYNHNPNNWFRLDDSADLQTAWLDAANNPFASRDGDIFMSCSDQGYLQSIYELGFLPRLTNPPVQNDPVGVNLRDLDANRTEFAGGFGDTQQRDVMWRTYRVFGRDADPLFEPGFVSGLHGLKVNPYSDSLEILSAAFANTPADWAHASTNPVMNVSSGEGADAFNKKYAWNAYSTGSTKLMWKDIQNLAYAYYDKVRTSPYNRGDWESAFEDLAWSTDRRRLLDGDEELDSSGSDMYSVDKKFLYGFWRDCFAANQQLFLIFVRAEPMMMGGGVAGNAPPQLSSRAVALVWRDPEGRKSGASAAGSRSSVREPPHGLRVLFYHPLD